MSQRKYKLSNILSLIFVSLAVACALAGCQDELLYDTDEIPDAVVDVEAEVIFSPLVKTAIETRASAATTGDDYKGIHSLLVFFFDENDAFVKSEPVTPTPAVPNSETHQRVTFKTKIQAGKYKVFAAANVPTSQQSALLAIRNITDLRNFKLTWDNAIADDCEMFGVFRQENMEEIPDNDGFESAQVLTITPVKNKIHSWVRRVVSKVTIDFDGSELEDGVEVQILSATLKHIPSHVSLGAVSKVGHDLPESGKIVCLDEDSYKYSIDYGTNTVVTNKSNPVPPADWNIASSESDGGSSESGESPESLFHDETARALPAYENMQGTHTDKCKYQDKDGDGIIDSVEKDGVDGGTYLEVKGYYKSTRPEYKSEGEITYRFMLGMNNKDNFDFMRNQHYKITMKFKGYGSDIDWHIDYRERYLELTYPQDVNYKGEFFTPGDYSWDFDNAGHAFETGNVITLTSYQRDYYNNIFVEPEITRYYYIYNDVTGEWEVDDTQNKAQNGGWLSYTEKAIDSTQKQYTFTAAMASPTEENINEKLKAATAVTGTYDLSTKGGTTTQETANCYIVNASGKYSFPLIYGNGNIGGDHFVNYLGNKISNSNILTDIGKSTGLEARLIWQDVKGLISNISINGQKIEFNVNNSDNMEGNAVIALIDTSTALNNDEYITENHTNTQAVWSWHIWVTRFGSADFEKNIQLTGHDDSKYDVLPVNLGWCSGGKPVYYFPRRKCEVTFNVQGKELVRTIEQYPHFAIPRGDNTYYQWGRKDPFVGSLVPWDNKERYDISGNAITGHPTRMYSELETDDNGYPIIPEGKKSDWLYEEHRRTTQACQKELIKNPDKWHNAPRLACDPNDDTNWHKKGFYSNNLSYDDLWGYGSKKTIYDPCPPGYRVGSEEVFSGFTVTGQNESSSVRWNDVLERNMYTYTYVNGSTNENVIEFYTDPRKIQSISIPVTGYRDYDDQAVVYNYGDKVGIAFAWTNHVRTGKHVHLHQSKFKDEPKKKYPVTVEDRCVYHLKVQRTGSSEGDSWKDLTTRGVIVAPREDFYDTDGFPVRPVSLTVSSLPKDAPNNTPTAAPSAP